MKPYNNRKKRNAFTMFELIFVIVVMGILAKFGVDLFRQIFEGYTRTTIAAALLSRSEAAVFSTANRLTYRIRDSVIVYDNISADFFPLSSAAAISPAATQIVYEWIGQANDSWDKGDYSGIIDMNNPATTVSQLISPRTSSLPINGALYFMGSKVNVNSSFGWHGSAIRDLYDYNATNSNVIPMVTPFSVGDTIWENYQIAESAYALELDKTDNTNWKLYLYKDYYPWKGEIYTKNTKDLMSDHVTEFTIQKIGEIIRIELCVGDNDFTNEGAYSICKTKIVF